MFNDSPHFDPSTAIDHLLLLARSVQSSVRISFFVSLPFFHTFHATECMDDQMGNPINIIRRSRNRRRTAYATELLTEGRPQSIINLNHLPPSWSAIQSLTQSVWPATTTYRSNRDIISRSSPFLENNINSSSPSIAPNGRWAHDYVFLFAEYSSCPCLWNHLQERDPHVASPTDFAHPYSPVSPLSPS